MPLVLKKPIDGLANLTEGRSRRHLWEALRRNLSTSLENLLGSRLLLTSWVLTTCDRDLKTSTRRLELTFRHCMTDPHHLVCVSPGWNAILYETSTTGLIRILSKGPVARLYKNILRCFVRVMLDHLLNRMDRRIGAFRR